MTVSRLGADRRRAARFRVEWSGVLTCLFADREENVEIRVTEISATGARLELKTLKFGPYHIVVVSESSRFILKAGLPEAVLCVPVRIVWYSTDEEKDLFNVGVMFLQTSEENRATIDRLIADVALETGGRKAGIA